MRYVQQTFIDPNPIRKLPDAVYKNHTVRQLTIDLTNALINKTAANDDDLVEKIETAEGYAFRAELYVFTRKELKEFVDQMRANANR